MLGDTFMASIFRRASVYVAVFWIVSPTAYAQQRTDGNRVNTDSFRKTYERNEKNAIERAEKTGRDSNFNRRSIEVEQSPVDPCSINPELPQCRIFR